MIQVMSTDQHQRNVESLAVAHYRVGVENPRLVLVVVGPTDGEEEGLAVEFGQLLMLIKICQVSFESDSPTTYDSLFFSKEKEIYGVY